MTHTNESPEYPGRFSESEERYRMVFEQAAVGVAHINSRTGEFLQINQRYCDLVGYSEQELIGKHFKSLTHPDDLQRDLDDMVRLHTGEIREFTKEKRYFHKNGSVVWIALTVSPMWHPGEEPSTHIAIVQDITPRKQAEKALRETKDRLQFLISDSPTVMYTSTPSGDFGATFVSENVTKLLGYKPGEFVDRSTFWVEHVHPDDVAHVINALPTLIRNGRHRFEYRFEHKQGGYRWIYDEPKVVRNSNGGLEEIIGYMIDITERKQAEQVLRERDDQNRALVKRLEKIQEAERTAISREIHDALGQAFTALQLDLSWFIEELVDIPSEVRERIESMLNTLHESGDTLRRISSSLRPAALDDLGLEVAIELTAEEFAQRSNLECIVSTVSVSPMEDERRTAVFRIFQEALTNIVRHGQARRFAVLLELNDGICTLVVEDDGIGIEEKKISSSQSIGLIGMRERAAWFGGELDIARKRDGGTAITLRMPVASG